MSRCRSAPHHVKVLGQHLIKRTVLFDGSLPIYHLNYSNADGDPSAVVTSFPFKQAGLVGRCGTNQAREVPAGSLNYWHDRLTARGAEATNAEVFDRRLHFRHPCGTEYGAGTIHHFAWNAETLQNRDELKFDRGRR